MEYVTAPWVNYEDFRLWMRKSFLLFQKLLIQLPACLYHKQAPRCRMHLDSAFIKKVFD